MQYKVTLNGESVACIPGTKKAARAWIKANVLSTHMGEWRAQKNCWGHARGQTLEYSTTIGRYYKFEPFYAEPARTPFQAALGILNLGPVAERSARAAYASLIRQLRSGDLGDGIRSEADLIAAAAARSQIAPSPGWIPEYQRIMCAFARRLDTAGIGQRPVKDLAK